MNNMYMNAVLQLEEAFKYAGIDPETQERLKYPEQTVQASLPMRHDDGTLRIYQAIACAHNSIRGVGKGGLRMCLDVNKDEVETLAFWMTFKTAITKIPFSGFKAGICVDSTKLSHREKERLTRVFVDKFADFIGPDKNVPGPDLYTDSRTMGWLYTRYREIKGGNPAAICTGKPVGLGGLPSRTSATGYGGFYVLEYALQNHRNYLGLTNKTPTMAIQGFGQVARWFAKKCFENGIKIVAISDIDGGYYDPNGLNILSCAEAFDAGQKPNVQKISNTDLLALDVDILAPCAIENTINGKTVDSVKAKTIIELANGPTTREADEVLKHKGIKVLPDIACNGGGVVMSYLEWIQNKHAREYGEEAVERELKDRMQDAARKMFDKSIMLNIPLRTGAYVLALKRIGDAIEPLGNQDYFRS